MPPATHTSTEEQAFMDGLLSGLNDSFFNAVPSPDPSPVKAAPRATPIKPQSRPVPPRPSLLATPEDVDMAALVDGAENWDWDDMESDFLTPKKNQKSKVSAELDTGYIRETCTRCIIERITEADNGGKYEKVSSTTLNMRSRSQTCNYRT
jgi:DNA replication ATP-dependent helicase Dna2